MTLSFIIKFAKLVINKRGSRGSLNLSTTRSKNKQVCENAVTQLHAPGNGLLILTIMVSNRVWFSREPQERINVFVFSNPNESEKKRNNQNKSLELNFNKSVVGVLT